MKNFKNCGWFNLFNNKNFIYNRNSKIILVKKNYRSSSFKLLKIIHHNIDKKKFNKIINFIEKIVPIKKGSSLLDFGSGNGALLYYFINKFKLTKNSSIEISMPLLNFQKKFIKETNFSNNIKSFQDNKVDNTICYSVFQYLNKKDAKNVLKNMIKITRKCIVIFDIKNKELSNQFKLNQRIRQNLSIKEFNKKYQNTPYNFYSKNFFINLIKNYKNKLRVEFFKMPRESIDYKFGYCVKISKK